MIFASKISFQGFIAALKPLSHGVGLSRFSRQKTGFLNAGIFASLFLFSPFASAQDVPSPKLGPVWSETPFGNPENSNQQTGRGLSPLPPSSFKFDGKLYQSVVSRVTLALPLLTDEMTIGVREAVISRRPDGSPITTHLMFVPGGYAAALSDNQAISALVVTRLRDDRPKTPKVVLESWEPPAAHRDALERSGVTQTRINTKLLGETIQRVIVNRSSTEPFPYQTKILRSQKVETIGITRVGVIAEDSFLEFSQILPCGSMTKEICTDRAIELADKFMGSVTQFLTYPKN